MKHHKDDDPTVRESSSRTDQSKLVLLIVHRDARAAVHRLPRGGTLQLGRAQNCAVRIDEPGISRVHALLQISPYLALEDLGSSNGTRLQGEPMPANSRTPSNPAIPSN
jgi:pSer/pThr/pTyr-binding forkhead associated (FHA) protein